MEVLIRPIVTEKMNKLGETLNRFGFIVDKRADKLQIKNNIDYLIDKLSLQDYLKSYDYTLSGGWQQRFLRSSASDIIKSTNHFVSLTRCCRI